MSVVACLEAAVRVSAGRTESVFCAAAGGVSAALTTPLDVAKTRIMLAERHSQLASGGLVTALRIIRRERGLSG